VADKMLVLRDGQTQYFGMRDEVLKALAEAASKSQQEAQAQAQAQARTVPAAA
jgi:ATP-binding cassette subfamily C exporter for protease/lipase